MIAGPSHRWCEVAAGEGRDSLLARVVRSVDDARVAGGEEPLFVNGGAWPLLLLAPLIGLLVHAACTRMLASRERWSPDFTERAPAPLGRALRAAVIAALLALAWMDPRGGGETVRTERRGVDLICCIDVSRSMLAQDLEPNRLERAKRDLLATLPRLGPGDRVALVAFAGTARLLVPLTRDTGTVRGFLEPLDWKSVRLGGSDLAAAIQKAIEALDKTARSAANHAAVVLMTDGEDHEGLARDAARAAATQGAVVHAIGYGSPRGSKITQIDEEGGESFVVSAEGDEVVTALDADGLRTLVELGGNGTFVRADAVALPLLELKEKRVDPVAERVYDADTTERRRPQFQWLLLPALLLLAFEVLVARGARR